ncbi:uncharacterized protein [Palaemon carinicauda]|uniref:uncharacterized protein n=1 Tax=Palaemon carinicauda TaxID=392227 RepID=UPI0035B57073
MGPTGRLEDPTRPASPSGETVGRSTPNDVGESRRLGQPSASRGTQIQSAPVAGSYSSHMSGSNTIAQGMDGDDGHSPICPICEKVFKTYAGRRLHERRAHAHQYHDGNVKRIEDRRNKPWSHEELEMMAQFEVSNCSYPFINKRIKECVLNNRSLDSINGKRKSKQYKDILKRLADMKEKKECKEVNKDETLKPTESRRECLVGGRLEWTSDEENSMVQFEWANRNKPHINKLIQQKVLPWRTTESVRTKRRTSKYKERAVAYASTKSFDCNAVPLSMLCTVNLSRVGCDGQIEAAKDNIRGTTTANDELASTLDDEMRRESRRSTGDGNMIYPIWTEANMTNNVDTTLIPLEANNNNTTRSQDGMNDYFESMTGAMNILAPDHGGSPPSSPDGSSSPDSSVSSEDHRETNDEMELEINRLKEEIFGRRPNIARSNGRGGNNLERNIPRKKRRRMEYAVTQRAWDKNRGRVTQNAILGKDPLASPALPPGTVEYRTALFKRHSPASNIIIDEVPEGCTILEPVTIQDVEWCKKRTSPKTSPGPDGIRAADFKAAANDRVAELYNLILQHKFCTKEWAKGRTTLLPKKDVPQEAGDFRPITVTSVVTHGLHKILSKRLAERLPSSVRQKGFKAEEGVSSNLLLLKTLIKEAKTESRTLYLAFIDFKKAFDSVSHPALLDTARATGLDENSTQYLKTFYSSISTEVAGVEVDITRGVMQGDPLSPLLFNIALDHALKRLPQGVGATLRGVAIQYIAFADDIVVVAQSRDGLTLMIKKLLDEAGRLGLEPGLQKCATAGIVGDRSRKGGYTHANRTLYCNQFL